MGDMIACARAARAFQWVSTTTKDSFGEPGPYYYRRMGNNTIPLSTQSAYPFTDEIGSTVNARGLTGARHRLMCIELVTCSVINYQSASTSIWLLTILKRICEAPKSIPRA